MERLYLLWLSHPSAAWLAIGAALLAMEVLTGSGWLLWPAAATLVPAGLTAIVFRDEIGAQWAVFALTAIALTWLGRRYLRHTGATPTDINDARAAVIGQIGKVTSADGADACRVMVGGKEWAADPVEGLKPNPGDRVEVVAVIGGARLQVKLVA